VVEANAKPLPLPNWRPLPGRLDIAVRRVGEELPLCAVELKLRELHWTLWDFFKMVDALALGSVEAAYLLVGTTNSDWDADVPDRCLELFRPAGMPETPSTALFSNNKEAWRDLLTGGSARPTRIPDIVGARAVASAPIRLDGERGELRCIAVEAHGEGSTDFGPDWFTGDWPRAVEAPTKYMLWRRRHWQLAKLLSEQRGQLPLEEVAAFAAGLTLVVDPKDGVRESGLVYRGEAIVRKPRGEPTLELTPTGYAFVREWAHKFEAG
jgi:hypothetical protein